MEPRVRSWKDNRANQGVPSSQKFQDLDNKTFLRALAVFRGRLSAGSIDALRELPRDKLMEAADATKAAADRAADFLATEIRAPPQSHCPTLINLHSCVRYSGYCLIREVNSCVA